MEYPPGATTAHTGVQETIDRAALAALPASGDERPLQEASDDISTARVCDDPLAEDHAQRARRGGQEHVGRAAPVGTGAPLDAGGCLGGEVLAHGGHGSDGKAGGHPSEHHGHGPCRRGLACGSPSCLEHGGWLLVPGCLGLASGRLRLAAGFRGLEGVGGDLRGHRDRACQHHLVIVALLPGERRMGWWVGGGRVGQGRVVFGCPWVFASAGRTNYKTEFSRKFIKSGSVGGHCSTGSMCGLSLAGTLPLPRVAAWFRAWRFANGEPMRTSRVHSQDGRFPEPGEKS